MEKIDYEKIIKKYEVKPNIYKNGLCAFIFGGIISFLGQCLIEIYKIFLNENNANTLMIITLIFISTVLTGFGVYDKIGQVGKAGTIVPITGFANSMASCAIEYKSEGIILGIASNLFKLAGSVITLGVTAAILIGLLRYLGNII